ncbi:glutathione transferase [Ranunculus cassubicifolius]
MEEVKLFGMWASGFSYRVIWALNLKGINYEYIEENLADKSSLLLQYNPVYKKIPVLVHGEKPIVESNIILEYIEETWREKPLLPNDPYEKAQARFWIKFGEDKSIIFWKFFANTGEEQEKAVKESLETLKTLEEHGLGDKKFFGGESIGIVDLSFGWIAHWLGIMEEAACVKIVEPFLLPRLCQWMERFKEVPAIKENLPKHDALLAHYKKNREMIITSGRKY